ncbi:hypothetical protein [Mitsuokella multacida]|uniref:hypothetical protein n=1 Tax=Mitsuokella multacida TaxID=52226 RepID=UPI0039F49BCE
MEKPKTMNELMRYYDHRIEELELKLAIAEEENSKLKSRRLSTPTSSTVLNAGAEVELYPDDIHEVLVDIIKDARRNILDGSRRADIIDDILQHNPVQGITDQKTKKLKAALKGYRVMDKTTKRKEAETGGAGDRRRDAETHALSVTLLWRSALLRDDGRFWT